MFSQKNGIRGGLVAPALGATATMSVTSGDTDVLLIGDLRPSPST